MAVGLMPGVPAEVPLKMVVPTELKVETLLALVQAQVAHQKVLLTTAVSAQMALAMTLVSREEV